MPAPTFVAAYNVASYTTTTTPKTVSVTTQAGDRLVVYGGSPDSATTLSTPSGNSISFTQQQNFAAGSNCAAHLWTGTDATGGSNWTLSCSSVGATLMWGFTCLVFRNSDGFGATAGTTNLTGGPSLDITTNQANSALVVFSDDWNALDGASRTWRTVNGITPSNGNGLELTYGFDSVNYTAYGGYYNDAGSTGSKTVGISAPVGQKYTIVAMEVLGSTSVPVSATVAWLKA